MLQTSLRRHEDDFRVAVLAGLLGVALAATASAQAPDARETKPGPADAGAKLARYVPREDLIVYLEFAGIDAHAEAWKKTAAHELLNRTTLGAMLTDMARQVADQVGGGGPDRAIRGSDILALVEHGVRHGFAFGMCGRLNPPDPRAAVLVLGGASESEPFRRIVGKVPALNEPEARSVDKRGGRKVRVNPGKGFEWWFEGDDAVFALAKPDVGDPILDALEGKVPTALDHPTRIELARVEEGFQPVGLFFVDLGAMPPLPPRAVELGLAGVKEIHYRWGFEGEALKSVIGVVAPRPRPGLLALFDQPEIGPKQIPPFPSGTNSYTLLSLDPAAFYDKVLDLVKASNPGREADIRAFADAVRKRTGLRLREDLLGRIGPRMSISAAPAEGHVGGGMFAPWFYVPRVSLVAEVEDPGAFRESLDQLMGYANRELRAMGGFYQGPPDERTTSKPGTEAAEFRRLKGPNPGYVLAVPPAILPTPAGLRPTIMLGRSHVAFALSPELARLALEAEGQAPARELVAARTLPTGLVFFNQRDPRQGFPELLANLPSLVQIFANLPTSSPNPPQGPKGRGAPRIQLRIDPDTIPDVVAMRKHLFPTTVALAVDDRQIRIITREAFPSVNINLPVGTSTPVLIALLLPAVQSAREAARRAQCVNNLKQIGLAMHNYHEANGKLPQAAIADKQGKPLLSWRVAILPFIDQKALYEKFKLDEPWDGPHNKALLEEMPALYACPSTPTPRKSATNYRVWDGKGAMFEKRRALRFADVKDGLSQTLMVVETKESVPWTAPEELPFDPERSTPLFGAGSSHPGGLNALFGDGSVLFLRATMNPETLRGMITIAGGEIIPADAR